MKTRRLLRFEKHTANHNTRRMIAGPVTAMFCFLIVLIVGTPAMGQAQADPAAAQATPATPAPAQPAPAAPAQPAPAAPAVTPAPATPPATPAAPVVKARLFYRDFEPKQLFQMLSDTYHVQFGEGAETITEPITLISKGDEPVDLPGMIQLLNDNLIRENKTAQLDGQTIRIIPLLDTQTRRISLKNADAQKVVTVLRDLYQAKPGDKPEQTVHKASFIGVHPQLNELLIRGSQQVTSEIEKFVKETLDVAAPSPPPPPEPPVQRKYITLNYIDAAEFQKLVVEDETIKDKFLCALAPNNTLIVSTRMPEIFAKIDQMKKTFDIDRMEIRYLPLSNAKAQDIADLLSKVYPEKAEEVPAIPEEVLKARREQAATGEQTAAAQLAEQQSVVDPELQALLSRSISIIAKGELTIIPDVTRNSLVIRTFSRNFPKVLELIEKLDRPVDQVMIDVFITVVTLDDSTEFGVDFSHKDSPNIGHNDTGTLKQSTGATAATTGLNYQLISDNITAYIHALQETNRLDVVTRPQVMTKDNAMATIELGRRVPLVTTTKVSTEGAISSDVTYQDVTTRLQVTPQIHPDSYISLTIDQTINDVSTETFQISKDFNPQVIIKRQAQSQLRVKDGQTICMGGFINDNIQKDQTKVPLLGDIPVLGYLFKFETNKRVKSELIIFITPHILQTPVEILKMTNAQRRQSNADPREDLLDVMPYDTMSPQRDLRQPPYRTPAAPMPTIANPPAPKQEPPAPPAQPAATPAPAATNPAPAPAPAAEPAPATPLAAPPAPAPQPTPPPAAPPAAPPPAPPAENPPAAQQPPAAPAK